MADASTATSSAALQPADPVPGRGRGVRPSRRAAGVVAVVAVLAVAVPWPPVVPLVLLAVVAGAVAVDMAVARRRVPTWARTRPGTLARGVGAPFAVAADPAPAAADRLRQPVPAALSVEPSEVAGGELRATLVGRHRGVHPLPAAVARVRGPLALGTCDHRGASPAPVTVFPDLPRARRLADARRRGRSDDDGRSRARLGLGTELHGIRDYVPDDDIRQVNWLATARAGRPLTNLYRVDENRDLVLLVDSGRLMRSPIGTGTRLDVALDALAVVAVAADDAGDRVGVVAFADDVQRVLPPRRRGAEDAVRALFDLEPAEVETDYERAFRVVGGRKRSLVVVFTDLVDPAAGRTLVEALPVLARRHAVVVASCRDGDLDTAVAGPVDDAAGVLRAAAAADLVAGQRRTAARLRAVGVDVVEADPERLGPAVCAAYGRLKRLARV